MLELVVTGDDRAARWLRTKSGNLIGIVTPVFLDAGRRVVKGLQEGYQTRGNPASYVRTGTYGRRTQSRHFANQNRITVNVFNMTPYAKWVGVKETQARVHEGRWPTDVEILQREAPRIESEISGALIRGLH